MMFGGWTGRDDHEGAVTKAQRATRAVLLAEGWAVVCDDTNLHDDRRTELARIAAQAGEQVEIWDLTGVPVELCIARDRARAAAGGRLVGELVIRRMHERMLEAKEND
jgi:predicted kinase